MEILERYLETFEQLRRRKRWSTDTGVLRFAALSLAASDLHDPAAELEDAASALRAKAGWFGPMNSPIRYAIAAMILRKGLRPALVHDQVGRTREKFRQRKLPRGGTREVLAALLLVLQNDGHAVPVTTVDRVGAILDRWKKDHWFLTGADDYPMAALHAHRGEDVEGLARRVESIYQRLRKKGFSRGDPLQLVSHILTLGTGGEDEAIRRFVRIRDAFVRHGLKIGTRWYDEVALLALTDDAPGELATRTLASMERLRTIKPKPEKNIAFSLASGLTMTAYARAVENLEDARDLAAITAAQAILDAQTAAMVACMAATTAATTAAAASS